MSEKPILFSGPMVKAIFEGRKTQTRRVVKRNAYGRVERNGKQWHIEDLDAVKACPYGVSGDRLWVKETFQIVPTGHAGTMPIYRADGDQDRIVPGKWKPSIFMPRTASRLTLEITGVRVERLQDISQSDAIAEGVEPDSNVTEQSIYAVLWDSINGEKHPRSSNPWVWVIAFAPLSARSK